MSYADKQPHVVAVYNQKGGIAKTTTAVNLTVCLAAFGRSVLAVDLDPQANTTKSLLGDSGPGAGLYDVIRGARALESVIVPSPFERVSVLPSTYKLAGIELDTASELRSQRTLAEIIRNAELDFDLVVIDCAPAFGLLSVNAIVAANAALIPVTASQFAYDGLVRTRQVIETIQNGLNRHLVIHGVLLTLMDDDPVSQDFAQVYRRDFKQLVYQTEIVRDRAAVKAAQANLPLCVYMPGSTAAQQYLAFTEEFLERRPPGAKPQKDNGSFETVTAAVSRAQAMDALGAMNAALQRQQVADDPDEQPVVSDSVFEGAAAPIMPPSRAGLHRLLMVGVVCFLVGAGIGAAAAEPVRQLYSLLF